VTWLVLVITGLVLMDVSADAAQKEGGSLRTVEFRYRAPEAGEVFLVWGIEDWQVVPETNRPKGTVVKNGVMHTPMTHDGDKYLARIKADAGVAVHYGFLVTKTYDGMDLEIRPAWDGREEFVVPAKDTSDILEIRTRLELFPPIGFQALTFGLLYLASAIGAGVLIHAVFRRWHGSSGRPIVIVAGILIVAIGLALRIGAGIEGNRIRPDNPANLIGDEPGYDSMARQFLDGNGFTWPGRVPLYPLWLAGVYRLSGRSIHAVPYYQSLLGVATIVLTYLLGRSMFDFRVGLLSAFWVSGSYVLFRQPVHLLSEVLYTPVLLLLALLLFNAVCEPTGNRFLASGAWTGIANLIRPSLLFFPLFLAVPMVIAKGKHRGVKHWIGFCAASFLVVSPWVLHNYQQYHAVIPLQTSNAILWQGSPEYYHLIHDRGYTYMRIWKEVLYKPGWEENDPSSVSGDRYWNRRALISILAEPWVYLKFAGEKAVTFWLGDSSADWGNRHIFSYTGLRQVGYSSVAAVQVIVARAIPLLVPIALFFLRSKWARILPVLFIMGYFNLLHALTHAEARLSEPLQPFLLILISALTMKLLDRGEERDTAEGRGADFASGPPEASCPSSESIQFDCR